MTTNPSSGNQAPFSASQGDLGLTKIDALFINKEVGFHGVTKPVCVRIPGADAQTAANYTTPFFIADRDYEVLYVTERHETAGSDAGAVTVQLYKAPSGTAPASGTAILSAALSLKATANTNQSGVVLQTYATSVPIRRITEGDCLALVSSGTLTAVVGVTVSVVLRAL